MKEIFAFLFVLSLLPVHCFAESCAVEKKEEYEKLLNCLYELDVDEAFGAKEAYKIVTMFEAVADNDARCKKMDSLLYEMRKTIELYQ